MRVIVTGGAGFIGSALCRRLVGTSGWSVLNVDKLTYAANLASLADVAQSDAYRFIEGDIGDRALLDQLFADFRPQGVMHLAAESHVDRSISGSSAFVQTNIVGTHTLLEATTSYWERLAPADRQDFRLLHVSTDEVFGTLQDTGRFSETSPYDPRSPYSASKAASDHLVRAWGHTFGLPILISNCSNNYGPYHFPEKLIPLIILNALEWAPLPVYGDGKHIRDWLHVDDHVAALELIITTGRVGETYTIGGGNERTNLDVVHTICDLLDDAVPDAALRSRRSLVRFVPDRPGHDRRYAVNFEKIERELGWRPNHAFDSGMRATVAWYLQRRDWWEPIRKTKYAGERLGLAGSARRTDAD